MDYEKNVNSDNMENTELPESDTNIDSFRESAEESVSPAFERLDDFDEPAEDVSSKEFSGEEPDVQAPPSGDTADSYNPYGTTPVTPYRYSWTGPVQPIYQKDPMPEEPPAEPPAEAEEPTKKTSGGIWMKVISLAVAFVVGVGISSWLSFLALPKLVERELKEIQKSNPQLYLTPPNPAMTAEEAGAPDPNGEKELLSVVEIARRVGPAVVGINTMVERQNIFGSSSLASGSGSGIILTADGYIVTNNHVIEGANTINVILSDGEEYPAVLIGADARTDLAVVKIEGDSFPTATLGNSSELQVGELAVAIGNPLGNELAGSVTGGYISALNRSITVDDQEFNLIQTDAAINPGNSGGALVNNYGEVIGINSVKMSASGVEGIGFAIPIDEAKPIIDDLIANGYVQGRPVIGIVGRDVSEQDAMYYDLPVGIYVVETSPYSAAERAGIKIGDVITAMDGITVKTVDELNQEKEKHVAGDTVVLTVIRDGETLQVSLTLQEDRPTPPQN